VMDRKWKIGIGAAVILIIAFLLWLAKYQHDMLERQKLIESSVTEQKELTDGIMRAQAGYATKKDLEKWSEDLGVDLTPIRDDLEKLNADIQGISAVKVVTVGYRGSNIASTSEETRKPEDNPEPVDPDNPDPHGYQQKRQILKLNEPFSKRDSIPFGEVGFSAWKKRPWDLTVAQREYRVVNVLGQDEDGRHYVYNKFSIVVDGEQYDIKISDSKFVEKLPESKFRFSPRLYFGMDGGAYFNKPKGAAAPNMQLFFWSKGRTRTDPDWILLGVGAGYEIVENKIVFLISPVSYNVGHHLPLVDNIFLGPSVSTDVQGNIAILFGARVGL